MTKRVHGTSIPQPPHTKNATRAEPLLNNLLYEVDHYRHDSSVFSPRTT